MSDGKFLLRAKSRHFNPLMEADLSVAAGRVSLAGSP